MNRWGMRDRDYEKVKPAGTFRAALMGDSYAVGLGVPPDSTWESLVEARLSASPPKGFERAEILNFSVGGFHGRLEWRFFDLIDHRKSHLLPTVLTTNAPVEDLLDSLSEDRGGPIVGRILEATSGWRIKAPDLPANRR